jgi:OOP family OmpA-OmpF porin
MGNLMAGITGQIKLSNRVALTGDFTTIIHGRQNLTFDGASSEGSNGLSGTLQWYSRFDSVFRS